jgi:aminoglycoside 6'-N-acetyltransferase I
MIRIFPANPSDKKDWLILRHELWPDSDDDAHLREIELYLTSANHRAWLAKDNNRSIGFVEATLRQDYVEGCATSPVAYLEGIYVRTTHRNQGVANTLMQEVERWAKQQGCTEMGSDTQIDNQTSVSMHKRMGFSEASRNVHFVKQLA